MLVVVLCLVGVVAFLLMGDKEGDDGINSGDGVDSQTLSIEEQNRWLINASRMQSYHNKLNLVLIDFYGKKPDYIKGYQDSTGEFIDGSRQYHNGNVLYYSFSDNVNHFSNSYIYDDAGYLTDEFKEYITHMIHTSYDCVYSDGRIDGCVYKIGDEVEKNVSFVYDGDGRITNKKIEWYDTSYQSDLEENFVYEYDSGGRIANVQAGHRVHISYSYTPDGKVDSAMKTSFQPEDAPGGTVEEFTYQYNPDGSVDRVIRGFVKFNRDYPELVESEKDRINSTYVYEYK